MRRAPHAPRRMSAQAQQAGMTLVEVLTAIMITTVLLTALSSLMVSSIRTDGTSRARTTINTVVESWLDRYRANQEPFTSAGAVCTGNATSFTCTYPTGHDFASDGVYSHDASDQSMNDRFGPYRSVITGRQLQSGVNRQLWQINVQVRDERLKQTVEATSYVLR